MTTVLFTLGLSRHLCRYVEIILSRSSVSTSSVILNLLFCTANVKTWQMTETYGYHDKAKPLDDDDECNIISIN